MRWIILAAGLLVFAGCYNERIARPVDNSERVDAFNDAFTYETRQNDRVPAIVNKPPVISRGTASTGTSTGPHVDASGPVVVAATGPATRPIDPYTSDYRPSSVVTMRGPIVGFRRMPLSHDRTGLFAKIQVGGEFPEAYLGPEAWLIDQGLAPEIANPIEVTGSRVETVNGTTLIIARDATWRNTAIAIRNAQGAPLYPIPADADGDGVQ